MRSGKEGGKTNTVEVETIAEHQLPGVHGFGLERLDRTKKRETELRVDG